MSNRQEIRHVVFDALFNYLTSWRLWNCDTRLFGAAFNSYGSTWVVPMSSRGLLEPWHFRTLSWEERRGMGCSSNLSSLTHFGMHNYRSSRNKKPSTIEAASKAKWKVILQALSRKEFEGLQPQCFGTGMQSRCTIGRRSGPLLEAKHIKPSNKAKAIDNWSIRPNSRTANPIVQLQFIS